MTGQVERKISSLFLTVSVSVISTVITLALFVFVFGGMTDFFQVQEATDESSSPEKEIIVEIRGYEEIVVPIAEMLRNSIVGIRVTANDGIFENAVYEASGVIYSEDGLIITNQHVIAPALDMTGRLSQDSNIEVFVEGKEAPYLAELIGADSITDLALIKIQEDNLNPVQFGDSDYITVGQMVVAIGSPGGLRFMGSVSQGIISGIDREVEFGDGTIMQLIQTDAAVNPGNSGGALVDSSGKVIGINNAGLEKNVFEGINFAIPSNLVIEIIEDLRDEGYITGRSWLGVYVMSDLEYESIKLLYEMPEGVFVSDVEPESPAEEAGLQRNDVIVEFNSTEISGLADLRQILNESNPGDTVTLRIYRLIGNELIDFEVVLGERAP